jgi:ketosteroid isomerase-like protein
LSPIQKASAPSPISGWRARLSANLDLVRSICAPWERGDYSSATWAHPEIELVILEGPVPGTWNGLTEMAEYYRQFLSAWDDVRTEVEEYRELDSDRVLALTRTSGRGKTSGMELDAISANTAALFYLRDAGVVKLVLYWNRERVRADLGLAE